MQPSGCHWELVFSSTPLYTYQIFIMPPKVAQLVPSKGSNLTYLTWGKIHPPPGIFKHIIPEPPGFFRQTLPRLEAIQRGEGHGMISRKNIEKTKKHDMNVRYALTHWHTNLSLSLSLYIYIYIFWVDTYIYFCNMYNSFMQYCCNNDIDHHVNALMPQSSQTKRQDLPNPEPFQ